MPNRGTQIRTKVVFAAMCKLYSKQRQDNHPDDFGVKVARLQPVKTKVALGEGLLFLMIGRPSSRYLD